MFMVLWECRWVYEGAEISLARASSRRQTGRDGRRDGGGAGRRSLDVQGQQEAMMQGAQHVETSSQALARTFGPGRSVSGLEFERFFSRDGVDPFDEIEWELRSAVIPNERGELVFEQRDVEFPKFWSQQATNIVVSKYFRGQIGTPQRERSVKQLIGRVVDTITKWAKEQSYFASDAELQAFSDELKHLLVYQKGSFNSPVW